MVFDDGHHGWYCTSWLFCMTLMHSHFMKVLSFRRMCFHILQIQDKWELTYTRIHIPKANNRKLLHSVGEIFNIQHWRLLSSTSILSAINIWWREIVCSITINIIRKKNEQMSFRIVQITQLVRLYFNCNSNIRII